MTAFLVITLSCIFFLLLSLLLDFDHAHSAQSHDHGLGGFLSLQSLLLFGVGFGSTGAVMKSYGFGQTSAILAGVAFGLLMTLLGISIIRALKRGESDSTPSMEALLHCGGYAMTVLMPGVYGEIRVIHNSRVYDLRAVNSTPSVISSGSPVKIIGISGHDVSVIPLHPSA